MCHVIYNKIQFCTHKRNEHKNIKVKRDNKQPHLHSVIITSNSGGTTEQLPLTFIFVSLCRATFSWWLGFVLCGI